MDFIVDPGLRKFSLPVGAARRMGLRWAIGEFMGTCAGNELDGCK